MFPQVSKDTRTAKKTVSRLGGYAAPNFRFFAILMHAEERAVLSRLVCTDGRETFLEPLTGIARHPFARTGCSAVPTEQQVSIFNITYIIPAATCDAPQPSSSGARTR